MSRLSVLWSRCVVKSKNNQEGQILLIVILTMVVALTVGISVISRTVTNVKTSKQNAESQSAFQAAEAGLDQALKQIQVNQSTSGSSNVTINAGTGTGYNYNVQPVIQNFLRINNGDLVNQDQGFDVWLSNNPDFSSPFSGVLNVYWSETTQGRCTIGAGSDISPALEILLLSEDPANPTPANPVLTKYLYDPCPPSGGSRRVTNAATPVSGLFKPGNGQTTYLYQATLNINNGLVMKIIPIFNSTTMAVNVVSGGNLPQQGSMVVSTGTTGQTVRKLQYFVSYPQIPVEFFQYAILSQ